MFVPGLFRLGFVATHNRPLASGDQLIMALSYTQKTSDNSLITKYVSTNAVLPSGRHSHDVCGQQSLYDQFGTYLTQNGLYMASQYSSDSFAGQLPNQTNLAVKVSLRPS